MRVLRVLTGGFGISAVAVVYLTWSQLVEFRYALAHGAAKVVTGCVSDLVPEGPDGHPSERLRVGDHAYTYSSYDLTPAFNRTVPHGGPMRDGLCVRIADLQGRILRLEVADHP
jgi:hypothetical protein